MAKIIDNMFIDFRIDGDVGVGKQQGTVFVKLTWVINPITGALEPGLPVELKNDFRDDELTPRLPPHSDYYPWKKHTDVAICGDAFSADGRSVQSFDVSISIGNREKTLRIFGERYIEFENAKPLIGSPSLIDTIPLSISNAYGGADFRVGYNKKDTDERSLVFSEVDHPGLYPRNLWGTGYLVELEPIEGMPLPTQEDPKDLLTNDRLLTGDPRNWFLQPLPAHFDWVPVNNYPRCLFFAPEAEPWFEGPDDESLPEVKRKILTSGYREHLKEYLDGGGPHWRFFQESPHDQIFSKDLHGWPVTITGMHPEYSNIKFQLPGEPPSIDIRCEQNSSDQPPLTTAIEIRPNELMLSIVYTQSIELSRPLLPGIHNHIPLEATIDGHTVVYETPMTVKKQLNLAMKKNAITPEEESR